MKNDESLALTVKKNILKALNKDYKYIIITYEGSGDSGAIEDISMSNQIGDTIWESAQGESIVGEDRDAIEEWAYSVPLNEVSDWYNNDGGYGMIIINVKDGTYTVENNIRFTDIELETYNGKV